MAKEKKKETTKTVLERTYNVPLRKEFLKVPRYKRVNKAVRGLRKFISQHMKSDTIKIGKYLNLELWKHGIKNPPHHVKVTAKKDEKGVVSVEIEGAPKETKKEEKKPVKKGSVKKTEEKKEEKQETAKTEEKEEAKIEKKEEPAKEKPEAEKE